jgi:hypothetical protein
MKKIFSLLTVSALILSTFSCEDEDKDRLEGGLITSGAILRTLSSTGATVDRGNPSSANMVFNVQFDDFLNQDTMESVDIFAEYIDTTPVGNVVQEFAEASLGNVAASAFSAGSEGKLEATISVNVGDAITAIGVDPATLYGGDIFLVRLALHTTNGQTFTSTNVGTKIQTSSAFRSPFRYSASVVCPPPAGDWMIDLQDSYGDGWNGAAIIVTVNDDTTPYTIGASVGSYTITVPPGSGALAFVFQGGDWDSEITYQITDPTGAVVADDGPTPDIGPIALTLDFCAP